MSKVLTTAAKAANLIKKELKDKFPLVKFSVKSKNFSMGNSVDIYWVDGPNYKEVEEITNKYQYGHFNGMEDIYEYSNRRKDIPQAKYVMTHREFSAEQDTFFRNKIAQEYGITPEKARDMDYEKNIDYGRIYWNLLKNFSFVEELKEVKA